MPRRPNTSRRSQSRPGIKANPEYDYSLWVCRPISGDSDSDIEKVLDRYDPHQRVIKRKVGQKALTLLSPLDSRRIVDRSTIWLPTEKLVEDLIQKLMIKDEDLFLPAEAGKKYLGLFGRRDNLKAGIGLSYDRFKNERKTVARALEEIIDVTHSRPGSKSPHITLGDLRQPFIGARIKRVEVNLPTSYSLGPVVVSRGSYTIS